MKRESLKMTLSDLICLCRTRLKDIFTYYLQQQTSASQELQSAMAYSVLNTGKLVRPLLVYAVGLSFDAEADDLDIPASAIELIHSHSLIHDDLPTMDNADLRRGKPTCHKKFGEALALLAGDTLQPLAYEIIASHPGKLRAEQRLEIIYTLSQACGLNGMAAGQAIDISGTHSFDSLTQMYQLKTGALLAAAIKLGAIVANIRDEQIINALNVYATRVGLAFQLKDDLLDIENNAQSDKSKGQDLINNKNTYPVMLGNEKTREIINSLHEQAFAALDTIGKKADLLVEFTHFLLQRNK